MPHSSVFETHMPERTAATAPHPMQGLQIKLVGRLGRNKFHRRTLHCFGDRFSVAIVILVTFAIRPHVVRRHQPGVMAKRLKFATEMMRPGAGLHADEARPLASLACWKGWSTTGPSHSRTCAGHFCCDAKP